MVICGDLQYVPNRTDIISNPIVIVEVLSLSTEITDRNDKFDEYIALPSLQEYILISQYKAKIERFLRHTSGNWLYKQVIGLSEKLQLTAIPCELDLAKIYSKIELDEA